MITLRRLVRSSGILLVSALALSSCSPRLSNSGGGDSDRLTFDQLSRYNTVAEAVQALRSGWLVARSPSGAGLPQPSPLWVYRDGTRVGGVQELRYLTTSEISTVQFFDGMSAFRRWGPGHENGVIHISSRRGLQR